MNPRQTDQPKTLTRKNQQASHDRRPAKQNPKALTGPRFTQIHNVKQQTIVSDRTPAGITPGRTDAPFPDQITQTLLVEVNGIEPMTSCLQSRRSTN
jgi:hypothetical protein